MGVRPTVFEHAQPLLEVHLFDFDEQIYGQHLRVDFYKNSEMKKNFLIWKHS